MSGQPVFFGDMKLPAPPVQAATVFAGALFLMLVLKIVALSVAGGVDRELYWVISGAFILLFSVYNSVLSLGARRYARYMQLSVLSFMLMMIVSGATAYLFSSLSIFDAGTFRSIYVILLLSYFTLLALAYFIKQIALLLAKDEERSKI